MDARERGIIPGLRVHELCKGWSKAQLCGPFVRFHLWLAKPVTVTRGL